MITIIKTIKTMVEIKVPFKLGIKVIGIGLIEEIVNFPKHLILGILKLIYTLFEILNNGIEWLYNLVDIIPELVIHCKTREQVLDFIKNYKKSIDKVKRI